MVGTSEEEFKWTREIPVPAHLISYVDDGVLAKLPEGTTPVGISPSGASYWARTARIEALDKDGQPSDFFIKVHQGEHGKKMVHGEYEAMKALHEVMPEMVAEPFGWGNYKDDPDAYFFVARFHELSGDIPDVSDFPELLAEMHKRSAGKNDKFGFPTTTYGGYNPVVFPYADSWEECFRNGLRRTFELEEATHGPDEELHKLRDAILNQVIPRLLRPLESEGRTLVPRLVHGDMWDGNASVDVNTGLPMIFDATPMWAHNEYELGPMVPPRHKMTNDYINEYTHHFEVSEPVEDFRDRLALYCLRFDLHASSLYYGDLLFRKISMDTMRELIKKYPLGYEGYVKEKGMSDSAIDLRQEKLSMQPDLPVAAA